MSALLAKALILARGHARRLLGRNAVPGGLARPDADVTRFEIPVLPAELESQSRDQLIAWYWRSHPRFNFFKKAPPGARFLDLGAGGGGLPFWREYGEPNRSDLRIFGVDLVEPVTRSLYEDFAMVNLDEGTPFAGMQFDAIIASHLIEHVQEPARLLSMISKALATGCRAYVEMPAPHSTELPPAQAYRDRGWPMMISNFHDDGTHRATLPLDELVRLGKEAGLGCVESGSISTPHLEDALIARGIAWGDSEILLYGYWSKTRWAQYAIFER